MPPMEPLLSCPSPRWRTLLSDISELLLSLNGLPFEEQQLPLVISVLGVAIPDDVGVTVFKEN